MNAETQNKIAGNVIIALIAGLILGFIAGSAWAGHKSATTSDIYDTSSGSSSAMSASSTDEGTNMNMGSTTTMTTGATPSIGSNTAQITISDSQAAGYSVTLPSTDLATSSWVAIRDNYSNKPNYILGAAFVQAGPQTNVVIRLSRATVAGNSYQVTLYNDTPNHVFNYEDSNIMQVNGSDVAAAFSVSK